MVRTKVQHKLISDEVARKTTSKKRKNGLSKKLEEITTLSGIGTCAFIIQNFSGKNKKDQLEAWPSKSEATYMLKRQKELPQRKQEKYMMNHQTMSSESLEKMKKVLKNQQEKNQLMEMELLLEEDLPTNSGGNLHGGNLDYGAKRKLNYKRIIVKDFIKIVTERIEDLESENKNK
ncbi:Agamous-like MADS-box protein AGL90 [Linum perenne]